LIGLPRPYTVPGIAGNFQEMYYWDTYFTGEGLLLDGHADMAANNVENMVYLVGLYGKMPNGNRTHFENRSQPPYLGMMVESVYKKTGDKDWLRRVLPGLQAEYHFWMTRRLTPCGLNRYSSEGTLANRERIVGILKKRLGEKFQQQTAGYSRVDVSRAGGHFIAEAESGWDFTPRFQMRCEDFCPVDLNANLYYYEKNFEYSLRELGKPEEAEAWAEKADRRKALMRKYLRDDETGLYYDYDFVNDRCSDVVSAAVFSLMYARILDADEAAALREKALAALEYPHGIATCAERDYGFTYQWSFPNAWAPLQYLAIRGLDNYGFSHDARRIAGKYVAMVANTYKTTNNLWEKYNVVEGNVNVTNEYKMPPMMGWTAGIFVWTDEYLRQQTDGLDTQ
jgi:alpha,alpha-trehalase